MNTPSLGALRAAKALDEQKLLRFGWPTKDRIPEAAKIIDDEFAADRAELCEALRSQIAQCTACNDGRSVSGQFICSRCGQARATLAKYSNT